VFSSNCLSCSKLRALRSSTIAICSWRSSAIGGEYLNSWMVYFMEKPMEKSHKKPLKYAWTWMIQGYLPFQETSIWGLVCLRTWPTLGITQIDLLNVKLLGDVMPKRALILTHLAISKCPGAHVIRIHPRILRDSKKGLPSTMAICLIVTHMYVPL
jgi:hypothetical protein